MKKKILDGIFVAASLIGLWCMYIGFFFIG